MTVPARISIVTLGVTDLGRSAAFYEALGWTRSSVSNDDIVWFGTADSALGLFPRDELAADAELEASPIPDVRDVTLAINLESERAVDEAMRTAMKAGASLLKKPQLTEYGVYSGYFADPDGHLWELAHNPHFSLVDGRLVLP